MGVNVTSMYINFPMNLWVLLKDMVKLASNELKLVLWIKSGEVIIPTKFEENMKKKLDFCEIYALWYSLYLCMVFKYMKY